MKRLTALAILAFLAGPVSAQGILPIPPGTEAVILARPNRIGNDPQLKTLFSRFIDIDYYLGLFDLTMDRIDEAALFLPDEAQVIADSSGGPRRLPADGGGLVLKGEFDPVKTYRLLKKKGWRERETADRKDLQKSESASYLVGPKEREFAAVLPGNRLLVTTSKEAMLGVLEISKGSKSALAPQELYGDIVSAFDKDTLVSLAAFSTGSDEIKGLIKTEIASTKIPAMSNVLDYVDRLQELGFILSGRGNPYLLDARFAMDSENSAGVVSGVLQIGLNLSGFFTDDETVNQMLSSMIVTRQRKVVGIQAQLSRTDIAKVLVPR